MISVKNFKIYKTYQDNYFLLTLLRSVLLGIRYELSDVKLTQN